MTATLTSRADIQDHLSEGDKAYAENRWEDVAKHLQSIADALVHDFDRLEKLGLALSRLGRHDEARRIFERCAELQPTAAKWLYYVGYQYYDAQDWRKALDWFGKALAIYPDYLSVRYRAAYCHCSLGETEAALEHLNYFVGRWEAISESERTRQQRICLKVLKLMGKVYLGQGLTIKAVRSLKQARELDPESGNVRYTLGKALVANKQYDEAITELETARELLGPIDYVLAALGRAFEFAERYDDAEDVYRRIPRHQQKGYILAQIGSLCLKQSRYEDAVTTVEQAVRKDRANHNIRLLLAKAYIGAGKASSAVPQLKEAVKLRKKRYGLDFPDAENLLASIADVDLADAKAQVGRNEAKHADSGRVESYESNRGFGFIRGSSGQKIFFHLTDWPSDERVHIGDAVSYTLVTTKKGPRAKDIRLGQSTASAG